VEFPENFDYRAVLWRPMSVAEWTQALLGQVNNLVAAGTLTQNQADGLLDKLHQVQAKLDAGQREAARDQLGAFIHQVEGLVNAGALAPEQAQTLIDAARGIIGRVQTATG
jgi:polyhydroxyalkanoate synthesis regulator phasin